MSGDRVLSEAESIVHSWYNRERNKSKTTHISNPVTSAMDDVITSAFHQASHGNVPAAVDEILNGLRDLPIEDRVMSDMEMYWREKNRDPRLGIEKRQTELKEKKNAREKEKIQSETKNFKPEVKTTIRADYHKRRIAEAVLHHQVNSFRDEVRRGAMNRREELTDYYTAKIKSTATKPRNITFPKTDSRRREAECIIQESHEDIDDSPSMLACGEQLLSARETTVKHSHTRRVLIAQLQEATHLEAKQNLQLLNRVFSSWHSLTAQSRIRLANAQTVDQWRFICRVFSAWKSLVSKRKEVREREKLAERMVKDRQADTMAVEHYNCKKLRNCFVSWKIWSRNTGELQRHAEKIREKRIKMAVFLEAAENGKIPQESNLPREKRKPHSHPLDIPIHVGDLFEKKIDLVTTKSAREKLNPKPSKEKTAARPHSVATTIDRGVKSSAVPRSISITIPDVVIVTSDDPIAPLYVPPDPPVPVSHPKKFTVPIPLTQMDERNALIIRRKRDREEKQRQIEEERAAKELEAEANRLREQEELKQAELARKQEEKRAVRARKIEKEIAIEKTAKQNRTAIAHYESSLLRRYCIGGLVKFRAIQVKKGDKADRVYRMSVQKEFFPIWREALELREQEKCDVADRFLDRIRLRRAWLSWCSYLQHYHELDTLATESANRNAIQKSLTAWRAVTRKEVLVTLRRKMEANQLFNIFLLRRAFRCFKGFIPAVIEEREREIRLDKLREKVREIIPDYGKYSGKGLDDNCDSDL